MAFARWRATITDLNGNVIPNASIRVVNEITGAIPKLYSDRAGTQSKGNPFVADGEGFAFFHVLGGAYRITATKGSFVREWRYVGIGTAQELDAGQFGENAGWDAIVDDVSGLDQYANEDEGFRVVVINASGTGRAAIYERDDDYGVWAGPIWLTGTEGATAPPNTLTIGTVEQTETPQVTITGESPNQVLNFGLVKGDTGDVTPELEQLLADTKQARDDAQEAEQGASDSAVSAATSADNAASSAGEAASSASAASISEGNSSASASAAHNSATDAADSASSASESASSAGDSASSAAGSASDAANSASAASASKDAAATSASTATAQASNASNSATYSEASANKSEQAQKYAWEWASNPEDEHIDDGTHQGFSAYHWSKKAELAAGGGVMEVVPGDRIDVDNSDSSAPVVSLDSDTIEEIAGKADQLYIDDRLLDIRAIIPNPEPGRVLVYSMQAFDNGWSPGMGDAVIGEPSGPIPSATFVWRSFDGVVRGGPPSNPNDLTNKTYVDSALTGKENTANKNVAGGYAGLDVNGKLAESQIPAVAITDTFVVSSETEMLALDVERGDIAVRTDIDKSFILQTEPASEVVNWVELRTPPNAVLSVNGKTGAVALDKTDVGLGNVENIAPSDYPISAQQQDALDEKVNIAGQVGLGFFSSVQDYIGDMNGTTIKPPLSGSNFKLMNNSGAGTLQMPDNGEYEMRILVHNATGAGPITIIGDTTPDPEWEFVTDEGAGQFIYIAVSGGAKIVNIVRAY